MDVVKAQGPFGGTTLLTSLFYPLDYWPEHCHPDHFLTGSYRKGVGRSDRSPFPIRPKVISTILIVSTNSLSFHR